MSIIHCPGQSATLPPPLPLLLTPPLPQGEAHSPSTVETFLISLRGKKIEICDKTMLL